MTRTAIGGERGDFGISAKQCPARLALSIADPRPGDVHDPARHCISAPSCSRASIRSTWQDRSRCCSAFRIRPIASTYGKTAAPVGLWLTPDAALAIRRRLPPAKSVGSRRTSFAGGTARVSAGACGLRSRSTGSRSGSGAQARESPAGLGPLMAETPYLQCRVRPWRA